MRYERHIVRLLEHAVAPVAPLYVFDTPGEGPAKRHLGGLYQGGIDHHNAGRVGGHATRQSGEDDHETEHTNKHRPQ
jgi:hypothetical protein